MTNEVEMADLVRACQAGDKAAFDEIFAAIAPEALRSAYLITGNRASAEDMVQEAFVTAYLKLGSLKKPEQFRSWFYKILTRASWRSSSRAKRQIPVADIYETAQSQDQQEAAAQYIRKEQASALHESIAHLPMQQREAVVLYYFSGFTVKEIAKITGALEGTVKSRLHNARKILAASLQASQVTEEGVVAYETRPQAR